MQLSVELTFYPFEENYIPPIKATINFLNALPDIRLQTFPTATIITGDDEKVFAALQATMSWCHEQFGRSVFVAKFILGKDVLA